MPFSRMDDIVRVTRSQLSSSSINRSKMGVDWDYCEICKETYPDCGDGEGNTVHDLQVNGKTRNVCENCTDAFGTLYYDESCPWYLARIPIAIDSENCWSVDDCGQIAIFKRFETRSHVPVDADMCREKHELASYYIGKMGKKAVAKLIKKIQTDLEREELSTGKTYIVYAMSLELENLKY